MQRRAFDYAKATGWQGSWIPMTLAGIPVACCFMVDDRVHSARSRQGAVPCPEPALLHSLYGPPPWALQSAVRLRGFVVPGRSWGRAAADAAALSACAPVAVVLDASRCVPLVMADADVSGIGLLARDEAGNVQWVVAPGAFTAPPPTPTLTLVHEQVYAAAWPELAGSAA